MSTKIGAEGGEFRLKIPSIDENADIQTAFKLYHYGDNQSGVGALDPESLAGYLDELTKSKVSKAPIPILNNANLNDYTESGFYAQATNAGAQSGANYPRRREIDPETNQPIAIGRPYAGLLRVFKDGSGSIYQEYQVGGIDDQSTYWRVKFGNKSFSSWQGFAIEGHNHDVSYYPRGEADDKYLPAIKLKLIRSPNIVGNAYTLTKDDEDSILFMSNGSVPHNIRVPQNVTDLNANISVGTTIRIIQANTGQTSVIPNSGVVTVNSTPSNTLRTIWSVATLVKVQANLWVLSGDLESPKTNSQLRNDVGIYVQQDPPGTANLQNGDLWFW